MRRTAWAVAVAWSAFHLYMAGFGFLSAEVMRPIHLMFALVLVFLVVPLRPKHSLDEEGDDLSPSAETPRWERYVNRALSLLAAGCALYVIAESDRLTQRFWFIDPVGTADLIYGLVVVALILEATRRTVGWGFVAVVLTFLVYQFAGPYLPGALGHRGVTLQHFIDVQILSLQGVFGVPVGVAAMYVFYFVLFGAFLDVSGGGRFFIDAALRLTGRMRGGPAKAAVVGSALMGSISGSAVANVVGTGIFTIPLMRKAGYPAAFAGGVEAAASSGGQILPPVMGAAAFIVAEFLGIPYRKVIEAAVIPALVYFVAVFLMVDLKARQLGLRPLGAEDLPEDAGTWRRAHLVLPVLLLAGLVLGGRSLTWAAFVSTLSVVAVSFLRRDTRMSVRAVLDAMAKGGRSALAVTIPCAAAGIVVGVVTYSGLGLKFSSLIVTLAGGDLLRALFVVMVGTIILGMGMPTASAYIMGAVLMAPALVNLGVTPLAAHFFVFYFACMSMVTPPVALAAYAAAGIARTAITPTSMAALGLSLSAFLVPFAFVYNPAILMQGSWSEVLYSVVFLLLGVTALSGAIVGFFLTANRKWETVMFAGAAVLLIAPHPVADVIGLVLLAAAVASQSLRLVRASRSVGQHAA